MKVDLRKQWYSFLGLAAVVAISALMAFAIERDWGNVDVSVVRLESANGDVIVAKLFRPVTATADNPLPAILNMHGYQNDKDVQDSFSIELARRGFIVLAPDAAGHGDSEGGINFGANPTYVMGNADALKYMIALPFVDAEHIGVMGHSLGGLNAVSLAALFPDIVDAVNGTARRMSLINTNHHLTTLNGKAVAEAVDWMRLALKGGDGGPQWIEPTSRVYTVKELCGFIALLGTLVSLIPLTNILLATAYFKPVAQSVPQKHLPSTGAWWKLATINMIIGGILYPLTTQWGGSNGVIGKWFPFMKLQMGNGVAAFFLANAVVAGVLFRFWWRGARKQGITMYDMGVSFNEKKTVIDWGIIGKTVLLTVILFMWMYLFEGFFQHFFGEEFRFAWPYMRQFATINRVGLFFIYMIPTLLFFLINGGIFLFGQARLKEGESPAKTQIVWWLKVVYAMVTGLVLVWLIQYLPWFLGAPGGPGFEILGLKQYGGMWPLMLWVYIPEFIILFFFHTWFYRRTGRIYLGALVTSSLITWFVAAGSVLAP
jgi:pimeloyl-ACP methyl ester carboxylesterase